MIAEVVGVPKNDKVVEERFFLQKKLLICLPFEIDAIPKTREKYCEYDSVVSMRSIV